MSVQFFFPTQNIFSKKRCKRIKINKINGKCFFQKLNQQLSDDLPNVKNFVGLIIASLDKKSLTEIGDIMNDKLNKRA